MERNLLAPPPSRPPMDEPLLLELGETLGREMPLSRAMQVETVSWDGQQLAMKMPLEPNRNHQILGFCWQSQTRCALWSAGGRSSCSLAVGDLRAIS